MLSKKIIFVNLVALGFLLGIIFSITVAEMPSFATEETVQFHQIQQPLGLKIGVTLGGLALIGLELWWFMFSKTKAQKAEDEQS